eukprot:g3515.t1
MYYLSCGHHILFLIIIFFGILTITYGQDGWREHILTEAIDGPLVVRSVDLDNDGDYDVLAASYTDKQIVWFENKDGQGDYGEKKLIATGEDYVYDVVDADFNCDGKQDIVFSDGFQNISANPAQCKKCHTDYAVNTNTENKKGSPSRTDCVCNKGFYQASADNSTHDIQTIPDPNLCKPCPYGAICEKDGLSVATLETKSAYWRTGITDTIFYRCENPLFCKGGTIASNGSNSNQCIAGHEGPLCQLCKADYALQGNVCQPCPPGNSNSSIRFVTLIFVGLSFFVYNLLKLSPKCVKVEEVVDDIVPNAIAEDLQSKAQDKALSGAGVDDTSGSHTDNTQQFREDILHSIKSKFRVLIGYLQINSALNLTFDVEWPESFQVLINSFKAINVDFSSIFTPISPCAFQTSFLNQFLVHMAVLPSMICIILVAVALSKKICWKKGAGSKYNIFGLGINGIVFWVFLLYPGMGTKIFRMFKCTLVGEKLYLVADFSVVCYEGEHVFATFVAILCIIVYVIGIPLVSAILLYRRRKDLDNPKIQKTFGSLYNSYKPGKYFSLVGENFLFYFSLTNNSFSLIDNPIEYWYFECLEMIKKMVLAGGLVIIRPGTSSQILLGLLVALAFCLIVVDFDPYADGTDNYLQQCCTIQIVLNLLIGLVLKLDNNTTGEYGDSMMGTLLVVMNLGVLVFTLVLGAYSIHSIYGTAKESVESVDKIKKRISKVDVVPVENKNVPANKKEDNVATLKELRIKYGASSQEYQGAMETLRKGGSSV